MSGCTVIYIESFLIVNCHVIYEDWFEQLRSSLEEAHPEPAAMTFDEPNHVARTLPIRYETLQ